VDSGKHETANGFNHPSSLIPHPSTRAGNELPAPYSSVFSRFIAAGRLRRGVTLVELLIVISIIVILTAASLKIITPTDELRVREAARAVNVYISSARNRAIEIGRPCGVIFRRANGTNFPTAATVLDQCEVPPTYAGDVTNSMVQVQNWTYTASGAPYWIDPFTGQVKYVLKVRIQNPVNISNNIIRPGDLIQFNNQGPYFSIERQDINASPPIPDFPLESPNNIFFDFSKAADTDNDGWVDNYVLTLTLDSYKVPMQALPWSSTAWSGPIAFKIMRQPAKSAAAPLQLPAGSVVDLDFSGTDYQTFYEPAPTPPNKYNDVTVLFSSNGSVEGYYFNNQPYPALGPIFMLIGSQSRVRDFVASPLLTNTPNLNDLPNWADLSSVWVTINYQTGMAASDEIFAINFNNPPGFKWTDTSTWGPFLFQSRTYARQSQSMGGR